MVYNIKYKLLGDKNARNAKNTNSTSRTKTSNLFS